MFATPLFLKAQSTAADTAQIKEACLNYVQGFYTGDSARVAKGVHADLAKRIVMKRMQYRVSNMTAAQLISAAGGHKHPDDAGVPFNAKIDIYDIDMEIATAKIVTNKMNFFDYVQLGKINGEWKIINVLWAYLS